ncbi:hypothetical protein GHT06_022563 [Daphnia sinensis]|uniref:Uncharacterized protein n=1 Tax=Daphnia sinensis TaxID=1820382 RepID=A0AAD5KHS4_9CRUS|nr:hypothetical protein GHT06_022563 [Daphnia sinensis]
MNLSQKRNNKAYKNYLYELHLMTYVFIIKQEFEDNDEDKNPTNLEEIQEWKRKDCKASGYILKTTKEASATSLPFRSNSTIRPPLVEDSSRHIKVIARTMELENSGPIRKPSTSTQMARPIITEPVVKEEAGVVVVVVAEAIRETKSITMEMELISQSTVSIVA